MARASVPPGTGRIVQVEWDLDGDGRFPVRAPFDIGEDVEVELGQSFAAPGTYFVTVRVASERDGDPATPYARILNLARARVVVVDPA